MANSEKRVIGERASLRYHFELPTEIAAVSHLQIHACEQATAAAGRDALLHEFAGRLVEELVPDNKARNEPPLSRRYERRIGTLAGVRRLTDTGKERPSFLPS